MKYPITLKALQVDLLEHAKDGRGGIGDSAFRLAIAMDNIGAFVRHYTHDQKENPNARPHGTPESRKSDAGHAIVQFLTYCAVEGIDLQESVCMALDNLREKDFMKKTPTNDSDDLILGTTGCPGSTRGIALVLSDIDDATFMKMAGLTTHDKIIVMSHPKSDARLAHFAGIVTDHGGTTCHAAIIAREHGIPCIVGTGNATKRIGNGDVIEIDAGHAGKGQVKKI
jgi:phosphohistidine swiveling domain-containing protein